MSNTTNETKPSNRFFTNAVIYNDYLYIFGGTEDHINELNDFWRYSLTNNRWEILKENYQDPIRHTNAILYGNKMIYYGGYHITTSLKTLVTINLDNFECKREETSYHDSFFHGTNLWNDELILVPSQFCRSLIMRNLKSGESKFFTPTTKYGFDHHPSSFIKDDVLYFTSKAKYLWIFDLVNKKFSRIEKKLPFICCGSTMKYYQGYIYYFGGLFNRKASNQFYKINFTTFEYEDIRDLMNVEARYGQSGFIYKDELILYGGYNSVQSFGDVIRFSLTDKFMKGLSIVLERYQRDISFYFF